MNHEEERLRLRRIEAKLEVLAYTLGGPAKQMFIEIDENNATSRELARRKAKYRRELREATARAQEEVNAGPS